MDKALLARRQQAADRHDAALERFPLRQGAEFERELRAVIHELSAVSSMASSPTADPVERARTLSWLGSAYFDLGRGADPELLFESARCYTEAEKLVEREEAPLLKAKLAFNLANTLRGQSGGSDIALLEAAEHRYEQATAAFKKLGQHDLSRQAEQAMAPLRTQLSLAREHAKLGKELAELEDLKQATVNADVFERENIRGQLEAIKRRPKAALTERVAGAVEEIGELVAAHPHLRNVQEAHSAEIAQAVAMVEQLRADPETHPSADAASGMVLKALEERLASDAASGKLSPDRVRRLHELLGSLGTVAAQPADDLKSLHSRTERMRELTRQAASLVLERPAGAEPAQHGSRSWLLEQFVIALKRQIVAEAVRPHSQMSEMVVEVAKVGGVLRDCGDDAVRLQEVERELWSLAMRFQRRRRLSHVSLVEPRWPDRPSQHAAKSVFVSGPADASLLQMLEARGHELLVEPTRGSYAEQRWLQLRAASVGLFWMAPVPAEGTKDPDARRVRRAQTCYDMGIALVLGMPIVVVLEPGVSLPFNVPVAAISAAPDADLARAVEAVAFDPPWGQFTSNQGEGAPLVRSMLKQRYGLHLEEGMTGIAWRTLEHSETPADFVQRLESLLALVPGKAPTLVFPIWPALYPTEPCVFHATAFRKWSDEPGRKIAELFRRRGVRYMRGDGSQEQRILRAIWDEIGRSTAVVADITELNSNVALELGIAHALGKETLLVYHEEYDADGERKTRIFKSIEKDQVYPYSSERDYEALKSALALLRT